MTQPRDLLNVTEAAKLLDVHPNTVRNWANDGFIWTVRLPRSGYRRIPRSEVIRLLREQCAEARLERKLKERL